MDEKMEISEATREKLQNEQTITFDPQFYAWCLSTDLTAISTTLNHLKEAISLTKCPFGGSTHEQPDPYYRALTLAIEEKFGYSYMNDSIHFAHLKEEISEKLEVIIALLRKWEQAIPRILHEV